MGFTKSPDPWELRVYDALNDPSGKMAKQRGVRTALWAPGTPHLLDTNVPATVNTALSNARFECNGTRLPKGQGESILKQTFVDFECTTKLGKFLEPPRRGRVRELLQTATQHDIQRLIAFGVPIHNMTSPMRQRQNSEGEDATSEAGEEEAASEAGEDYDDRSSTSPMPRASTKEDSINSEARAELDQKLGERGLRRWDVLPDNNCQFHAVAHQLQNAQLGQRDAAQLRIQAVHWLDENREKLDHTGALAECGYESWDDYLKAMVRHGENWGDHRTLLAMSTMLNVEIVVVSSSSSIDDLKIEPHQPDLPPENRLPVVARLHIGHYPEMHYVSTERRP
jgi:hypothetical protein